MKENLNLEEQKILWSILNQAQHLGLNSISRLLPLHPKLEKQLDDWLKQTRKEYDIINILKAKPCGD